MSVTVPDPVLDSAVERASAVRRPWPRFAFTFGNNVLEVRGPTVFLRLAGAETYVCTAETADWWTLREPGSFEAAAGRLRLSMSKASTTHDP